MRTLRQVISNPLRGFRKSLLAALLLSLCGAWGFRGAALDLRGPVRLFFPFGSAILDLEYLTNRESLAQLDSFFTRTGALTNNVLVVETSSYDGSVYVSTELARRRADAAKRMIISRYPLLAERQVFWHSDEDGTAFREALLADPKVPDGTRLRMLEIVDSDSPYDTKERMLSSLPNWRQIYTRHFPDSGTALTASADTSGHIRVVSRYEDTDGNRHVLMTTGPIEIYFRTSSAQIDPAYRNNSAALARINSLLGGLIANPDRSLATIRIFGASSPEGGQAFNSSLAGRRASSLQQYIFGLHPALDPKLFEISSLGEDYTGLAGLLQHSTSHWMPRAFDILGDTASGSRKAALRALDGGRAWNHMLRTYYPDLRRSGVEFLFESTLLPQLDGFEGTIQRPSEHQLLARKQRVDCEAKKTFIAVKTNLLFDAATMLNYAIEFPLGDRLSIVWEHYLPWWVMRNNRICVQYLTLGGEFRWWFAPRPRVASQRFKQRDRLVGHYFGLYGFWGKTDLQWDMHGRYQCFPVVSTGLTYGFAFPISRHLNLELSASLGYARIPYQHYTPSEDWQTLWRDRNNVGITHYFGPTKVQVSLVWPILINDRVREGARR